MIRNFKMLSKPKINNIQLLIFSVVYYGIIIFLSGYLNVWEDEIYSLNTSSKSITYAFQQSIHFEGQPPIYFLLLTLWRFISDTIFWARQLSVFIIIISQILLYNFAVKFSNKTIATYITILFLLNPVTVFAILEIRLFSLIILLTLITIILFYNSYYSNQTNTTNRLIYILFSILGLFTQFYFGFLLFANAVILIIENKKRSFWLYLIDMISPAILLLLFSPHILSNANLHVNTLPVYERTPIDFFLELKALISQVSLYYFIPSTFIDSKLIEWILRLVLIGLFIISLDYIELKSRILHFFPFVFISFIILLFFILVLCLFGKYAVEYKYTILLFVQLSIIAIFILKMVKRKYLIFWFIIMSSLYTFNNIYKYQDLYKIKDYKALSKYLEQKEQEGEPIFIFRNISAEILNIYYRGINNVVPIPDVFSYTQEFNPELWEFHEIDSYELEKKLNKLYCFRIIIDDSPLKGFNEAKNSLLKFVFSNYKIEEEKYFNGKITVYKFSNENNLKIKSKC